MVDKSISPYLLPLGVLGGSSSSTKIGKNLSMTYKKLRNKGKLTIKVQRQHKSQAIDRHRYPVTFILAIKIVGSHKG